MSFTVLNTELSYALFCEFVVNFCSNKHMSVSSKVFMYTSMHVYCAVAVSETRLNTLVSCFVLAYRHFLIAAPYECHPLLKGAFFKTKDLYAHYIWRKSWLSVPFSGV